MAAPDHVTIGICPIRWLPNRWRYGNATSLGTFLDGLKGPL
ncbi:hypothetical protein [Roseibium sp. SCP14]